MIIVQEERFAYIESAYETDNLYVKLVKSNISNYDDTKINIYDKKTGRFLISTKTIYEYYFNNYLKNYFSLFSESQINDIKQVVKVITEEFVIAKKKQKVDDEDFAKHFNRNMNPLRSHLELLCALIRSRNMGEKFQQLFSPYSKEIQKLIKTIEEIYEWLNPLLRKHNKIFFTKQIKFSSSDTTNSFLEYLLLWLDGQNSTKMPKIESATDDDSSDSVDESLDEE